jgi:hypothetical protein
LLLVGANSPREERPAIFGGVALTGILAVLLAFSARGSWAVPAIAVYLIGLFWMWAAAPAAPPAISSLAEAVFLTVPLLLFAARFLTESGAASLRQARSLSSRLSRRREWPTDLRDCRHLPEVKALRQALHTDAAPALPLLQHPALPVRVAALCALEFRKSWRPGQAEVVLRLAQTSPEPALRAAAVSALANAAARPVVEGLARFLLDPSAEVRRAATEAIFWEHPQRWPWVRDSVRAALSHPQLADEGPLGCVNAPFAVAAVSDLTRWAGEGNLLARRATETLATHYRQALQASNDPTLLRELADLLLDGTAPPALRAEVMHILHAEGAVAPELAECLLDPAHPSPLRLLAAESLLLEGQHPRAIAVLREIARQSNREQAVAAAVVVQRCLGVDLGLALNQPLPDVCTRHAADIARRVLLWATQPAAQEAPVRHRTPVTPVRDPELRPWGLLKPPNTDPKGSGAGSGVVGIH